MSDSFSNEVSKLLRRNEKCYQKFRETFSSMNEIIEDLERDPSVENYKRLLILIKKAKKIKEEFLEIENEYYKLIKNKSDCMFNKIDSVNLLKDEEFINYDELIREIKKRIKDCSQ